MKEIHAYELAKAVNGTILSGSEDTLITSVSTNSKEIEAGALFVPIVGERVDAHDFIDMALEAGAVATFTARKCSEFLPGKVYIQVEDTTKALQQAAAWYRSLFDVKIVGITGSVGKTTTKEMIAAALSTKYNVLKTKGNMNSQIGLPLMMFYLEEDIQVAVIEMGMSEVGEMERLAAIAKPDMAVMTNIGVSHIGQLGSQENIRKEKLNIIDNFSGECSLYLNGEDRLLHEMKDYVADVKKGNEVDSNLFDRKTIAKFENCVVKEFGLNDSCEFQAMNITIEGEGQQFKYKSGALTETITLSVLGEHNVFNATVALAVAEEFGIAPSEAKKGLEAYKPIRMRGQIYDCEGKKIIDDTYNASPDSMKSGALMLLDMEGVQRRILVFADVLELGASSRDCHYGVGAFLAETKKHGHQIDMVVTVGTEAKAICEAIKDCSSSITAKAFAEKEEAIQYLLSQVKVGDAILVKGSRGMHMEEVVEALKK